LALQAQGLRLVVWAVRWLATQSVIICKMSKMETIIVVRFASLVSSIYSTL
jgi:hypothetical protein